MIGREISWFLVEVDVDVVIPVVNLDVLMTIGQWVAVAVEGTLFANAFSRCRRGWNLLL